MYDCVLKQHPSTSFSSLQKKKKKTHGKVPEKYTTTTKSGQRFKTEEGNLVERNRETVTLYTFLY